MEGESLKKQNDYRSTKTTVDVPKPTAKVLKKIIAVPRIPARGSFCERVLRMASAWHSMAACRMAGACQAHGKSMAGAWESILHSPKETNHFTTPGVAFGTMTVAAVLGFLIYRLEIALAQADR